jgi:CheY-like chemotaxis protein
MISILLVDDESVLLDMGTIYLQRSGGLSVTTARSPGAAIALLEHERFDAVVTDYTMPGVEGAEFIRELRTRWVDLPIIVLSGRFRDEIVADCMQAGANAVIHKGGNPVERYGELKQEIAGCVQNSTLPELSP